MKKAQASSKGNARLKKEVRDKERDLHKMRKDIMEMKSQNETLQSLVKELKANTTRQVTRVAPPPRVQSAKNENNGQATF